MVEPMFNGTRAKAPAIILMLALIGAAPAEVPLAPAGKWTLDYADGLCVLQRAFGTDDAAVTLGITPSPLGDTKAEFVLLVKKRGGATENGNAVVTLLPSNRAIEASYSSFALDEKSRITRIWVDQAALAGLDATTEIAFTTGGKRTIRVAPTSITKALVALHACEDNLLRSWDIDPAMIENVATLPQPINPATWFREQDYPSAARRTGDQGNTTTVFKVGVDGAISACRTVIRSNSAELDQAACNVITNRGRYRPAIGKDGKPVATFASKRVAWRLTPGLAWILPN